MHPSISKFTSKEFYDSKLVDAPDMATRTHRPWHANPLFPPYALLDVWSKQESRGTSWCNRREAETALALYIRLTNEYPQTSEFQYTVCVVSPYAAQIEELKRQFENALGTKISERVAFHMIDGFQGQEKDIIILSCVRAGSAGSGGIGFLKDRAAA